MFHIPLTKAEDPYNYHRAVYSQRLSAARKQLVESGMPEAEAVAFLATEVAPRLREEVRTEALAAREAPPAPAPRGGDNMSSRTGKEALEGLHAYARRTKRAGESDSEALARAASEKADLYRQYDESVKAGTQPVKAAERQAPASPSAESADGLRAAHEASGSKLSFEDWLTWDPAGRKAYARYDDPIRRPE